MARAPLSISSSILKDKAKSLGEQPILGSTLQSIKRGKSTEVDYLNGEIVSLGKRMGIPTPVNSLMVELVHKVESTGKFLTIDELAQRLGYDLAAQQTVRAKRKGQRFRLYGNAALICF